LKRERERERERERDIPIALLLLLLSALFLPAIICSFSELRSYFRFDRDLKSGLKEKERKWREKGYQ
jgi:hypothetical protein